MSNNRFNDPDFDPDGIWPGPTPQQHAEAQAYAHSFMQVAFTHPAINVIHLNYDGAEIHVHAVKGGAA